MSRTDPLINPCTDQRSRPFEQFLPRDRTHTASRTHRQLAIRSARIQPTRPFRRPRTTSRHLMSPSASPASHHAVPKRQAGTPPGAPAHRCISDRNGYRRRRIAIAPATASNPAAPGVGTNTKLSIAPEPTIRISRFTTLAASKPASSAAVAVVPLPSGES